MPSWQQKPWLPEAAHAVRVLAAEMITQAQSGHPGLPLGMAEVITVLWNYFLKYDAAASSWPDRDRLVLSNGHGSAMLYAVLHLSGFAVSIEDLQQFRQLRSHTPGHPEYGVTDGVEVTTGPLGQGVANAVGLALAERTLAATFNHAVDGTESGDDGIDNVASTDAAAATASLAAHPIDHFTYLLAGDGCLMEGVAYEALSLAGTQQLDKLILLWDANGISIDGQISGWFDEEVATRFQAMHWRVLEMDGHAPEQIYQALWQARFVSTGQPTLIICHTKIGWGSIYAGSNRVHGTPLTLEELVQLKADLGWSYPSWQVPATVYQFWRNNDGPAVRARWLQQFQDYQRQFPALAAELQRRWRGDLPSRWSQQVRAVLEQAAAQVATGQQAKSTRHFSQQVLAQYQQCLPELLGGSADLTGSNLTATVHSVALSARQPAGNYLHYGVREFGMLAIMNGLALHGGFIPFGGTYLTFVGYGVAAIRMAALMGIRVIYLLTHDSIGVGEDGPTHQPVEQLTMLRAMPNLAVWRPASALETAVAWTRALERREGPTAILLSRQSVAPLPSEVARWQNESGVEVIADQLGGYLLWEGATPMTVSADTTDATPANIITLIIIATGSELPVAYQAAKLIVAAYVAKQRRLQLRVVSVPCLEFFQQQSVAYQESVLPGRYVYRVAIEAAVGLEWHQLVATRQSAGLVINLQQFGYSAPAAQLFDYFGFTADKVAQTVINWLDQQLLDANSF